MTTTAVLNALNADLDTACKLYQLEICSPNPCKTAIASRERDIAGIRAAIVKAIAKGVAFRKSISDMRKLASIAR